MTIKDDINEISRLINKCNKCKLSKIRGNTIPGEGSPDSDIMFIGEAPGYTEDIAGKPFVGRAGKIFDELIKAAGIIRKEVFITNILKCRPPKNRNPLKIEIENCREYLDSQIKIVNPKVIVTLGSFATSFIFNKYNLKSENISRVHGKTYAVKTDMGNIFIIPFFHPAISIYNPKKKIILIEDFKRLESFLNDLRI
jgi:DNA polymerase